MTRLLLIRHGYSSGNKERRFSGQLDLALSRHGEEQAKQVSKYILKKFNVDSIYSSDLSRAVNTVKPIAEALDMPIHIHPELREINEGVWQGQLMTEVEEKYPDDYARYKANLGLYQFEGGECYSMLIKRLLPMIEKIASENIGKTVVIATHGAVIRGLLAYWQNISLENLTDVPRVPNGTVTEVELNGENAKIIKIGFGDFLEDITGVEGVD